MVPSIRFFKRYRMERSLCGALPAAVAVRGFQLVPWHDRLLERHAHVLNRCFAEELDGDVFPCLRSFDGCLDLMRSMRGLFGFSAAATWLLAGPDGYVGTVQGLLGEHRFAAVQNIGIVPEYRGMGLSGMLLSAALAGFQRGSATRVSLEVTASNLPAVRLYRKFGFRNYRLLYKSTSRSEAAFAGTCV
jgi:ribosomal protein S18 acetylase RimI-like enzyme